MLAGGDQLSACITRSCTQPFDKTAYQKQQAFNAAKIENQHLTG